jgi:putative oxidoreductase
MPESGKSQSDRAQAAILAIRLLVGAVFFMEGIKKFIFAEQWGAGRFTRIGIPAPHVMGPVVGTFEIVCGLLVVLGLWTRAASVSLLCVISTAIVTTKFPVLLKSGFWSMEDVGRTDYSMFMGLIFLLLAGSGSLSLDAWRSHGKTTADG